MRTSFNPDFWSKITDCNQNYSVHTPPPPPYIIAYFSAGVVLMRPSWGLLLFSWPPSFKLSPASQFYQHLSRVKSRHLHLILTISDTKVWMMSSPSLSWSLMSKVRPFDVNWHLVLQLLDDSLPRIPTDLVIHLVDDDGEWEEGFQVVREPVQVRGKQMLLIIFVQPGWSSQNGACLGLPSVPCSPLQWLSIAIFHHLGWSPPSQVWQYILPRIAAQVPSQQCWLTSMGENWSGRGLHPLNRIRHVVGEIET